MFGALAGECSAQTLYRSWRESSDVMTARIVAQVEVAPGYWGKARGATRQDPPPTPPSPPSWHEPTYSERPIQVTVRLERPAPLRPGEIEAFAVAATHSYGQPSIRVTLTPVRTSWTYSGQLTAFAPASSQAEGAVAFSLTPRGRHAIRPPNALTGARVGTGLPDDPMVIEFDDPGLADDGNAATTYPFTVHRKRNLWPDKLIASGVYRPEPGSSRQRIVIEKGGPFNPGSQYLVDGGDYQVCLRIVKYGQDYTPEPSDETRLDFRYRASSGSYSREASRTLRFERMGR